MNTLGTHPPNRASGKLPAQVIDLFFQRGSYLLWEFQRDEDAKCLANLQNL